MSESDGSLYKEIFEQFVKDSAYVENMKSNPRAAMIREFDEFWDFSQPQTCFQKEPKTS